jgi:hypothetical protein
MSKDDAIADNEAEVSEGDASITAQGLRGHLAWMCRIAQLGGSDSKESVTAFAVPDHSDAVQIYT